MKGHKESIKITEVVQPPLYQFDAIQYRESFIKPPPPNGLFDSERPAGTAGGGLAEMGLIRKEHLFTKSTDKDIHHRFFSSFN